MSTPRLRVRQAGFTLVELLVSLVISLIAIGGMILVMANMVGVTGENLNSARLSNELRTAMQVVTRELRRANFDEDFTACVGSGSGACTEFEVVDTFDAVADESRECLGYAYRRKVGGGWQPAEGAMRLNDGVLEFNTANGSCGAGTWVAITDGDVVDIFDLEWDNDQGFTDAFDDVQQDIRKIRITLTGRVCAKGAKAGCTDWRTRSITNTVYMRNAIFYTP